MIISKRDHKLVADSGVLLETESFLPHALTPSVVGQTRRYHMKRYAIGTLLQCRKQFCDFDIGPWPAMDEQQRNTVWRLTFLVYIVDIKFMKAINLDAFTKVGELVKFGLLRPPVESVLPVLGQSLDVCEWCTLVPSSFVELNRCQQVRVIKTWRG